jgi:transcriptional regulator with XRE-family HTH domain
VTLTLFGKSLRKLRIDRDISQSLMAAALGVSPAFLSAVELGKRSAPSHWIGRITECLDLHQGERQELENSWDLTENRNHIRLVIGPSELSRKIAFWLERRYFDLDEEILKKIQSIISQEKS